MRPAALAALAALCVALLVLVYRAGRADGFAPEPEPPCCGGRPAPPPLDRTARNAAGTVYFPPYSTQSRVSLERAAETPEDAEALNPYAGLGLTNSVRAWSDRYRRQARLAELSEFERQPYEPGFLWPTAPGDAAGAMSLVTQLGGRPRPGCSATVSAADAEFLTDGLYGDAVLN